jgi:DNA-binding transcriptional LysR family regulator
MSHHHVDLEDLQLLVDVARHGSIGGAAAERGLTQPWVSRRMTRLETRLGVPLLARSRRGTTLTPGGQAVVGWAASLLAAADDFTRSVRTLRENRRVAIRAAVSLTIAEHIAPGWLSHLHDHHPELQVSLVVQNSTEVAALVEEGEADLGFVESLRVRESLERRTFATDRLVVAVVPGHPWADRATPLTPDELAASFLLVREPGSGTRETLEQALESRGLDLSDSMVMGSNAALREAAVSGVGPVVLSTRTLDSDLSAGRLVEVPVDDLELERPLSVVWRRGARVNDAMRPLLDAALRGAGAGA